MGDNDNVRVAAFREQPHAKQCATILREKGYDIEVVVLGGTEADPRVKDLCEAVREAAWARAFLISNCELEYFEAIVKEHFGDIIFQRRLRWAS